MNNTMLSGMLQTFKTSYSETDPLVQLAIDRLLYDSLEESYFLKGLSYLTDKNKKHTQNKIKFYQNINESGSRLVALEGFADYAAKSHDLIDETIKFMKQKLQDGFSEINGYIDSDRVLAQSKSAILNEMRSYQVDLEDVYRYTLFEDIPNSSALENFNASLFDELFEPHIEDLSIESVRQTLASIDLEKTYRYFRAALLNSDRPINDTEFAHELHKVFRNGKDCPSNASLNNEDVLNIARLWYQFKSIVEKPMWEHLDRIDNACDSVLDKIESICRNNNNMTIAAFTKILPGDIGVSKIDSVSVDATGVTMSPDMLFIIDRYTNLKLDQLQKFLDLTCMAFMAKLDAIRECVNQSRIILLGAVQVLNNPSEYYDARLGPSKKQEDPIKDILQDGGE